MEKKNQHPLFTPPVEGSEAKPVMLFDNFWHLGELAVVFGNQQSGKSVLAVQIAEAISAGKAIEGFKQETDPLKVLYFDFDKSSHHFAQRYIDYEFSPNFKRLVVNKKTLDFKHLAEQFFTGVEQMMHEEGAEILVFDSLPSIRYFISDSYFLKGIQRLKNQYDVSILVVGETRNDVKGKALRMSHLASHKHLCGFADSVFALGHTSGDADERYLIHLKAAERRLYDRDNVVSGRMTFSRACFDSAQHDTLRAGDSRAVAVTLSGVEECERYTVTGVTPVTPFFPKFVVTGYNTERYLLLPPPEGVERAIVHLKRHQPQMTLGQIANLLKTNKMKVKRVLDRYQPKPEIENPKVENSPLSQQTKTEVPLPTNPFRGDVEPSKHTSKSGVNSSNTRTPIRQAQGDNRTDSRLGGNDSLPHDGTKAGRAQATKTPFISEEELKTAIKEMTTTRAERRQMEREAKKLMKKRGK